ncbi:MAG: TonB-dependent receptor [bacterium]
MRCILLFLILTFFTSRIQAQCVLNISGVVKDADTRAVLESATVSILELKRTVTTDKDGKYIIAGLCPGDYTIRVSHADCRAIDYHFHLKEDITKNVELSHTEDLLREVVVVGSASVRSEGMTGELKGKELAATRGLTLGESLQRITGVTVLQTGNNIYKPVIQGLHSSRVLILNNGIRQEGQQWGSEHAPEIDPYIANRLTVIKGAASVRYGGDAIGGVVLVEPRLLQYKHELNGELNLAAFSNNRQGVVSAMAEGGFDKQEQTAWRIQGTLKRGGNARTPDYWLRNSGSEEMNMSAAAGWKKKNKGLELFYSVFNTRIGIFNGSHIGNLTDLENVIRSGEPSDFNKNAGFSYVIDRPYQSVQHHLVKLKAFSEAYEKSRISLIISSQYNMRKEFDITRSESSLPQLQLDLLTNMADLIWEHFGNQKMKGSMGLNLMHQNNSINYRYFVPNYSAFDVGVWIAERYQTKAWQFEVGLRYDNRSRFDITDNDRPPYNTLTGNVILPGEPYGTRHFSGISGTGVAAYKFNDNLRLSFTTSTAWRAPQVNELFSNGLHHGAARIEKGDDGLHPERAYSVLGSLLFNNEKWEAEVGAYNKWINDFIYLIPTYPALLTIRGAFPAFVFAHTDARLTGLDLSLARMLGNHFRTHLKASLLRAYDRSADTWLIQMPSDRYDLGIEYRFVDGKKFAQSSIKLGLQHVTEQKRVPPTGNIEVTAPDGSIVMRSDYAPPPPAYSLANIEASTNLLFSKRTVGLVFSIDNLLNTRYRDYMNAFRYFALDRGRNISIKIKFPF